MGSQKQIETLLEKYWVCETSREEERILKDFFSKSQGEIPAEWQPYASFFIVLQEKGQVMISEEMSIRLNEQSRRGGKKPRKTTSMGYLRPAFRIAAAGLILVVVGLGIDTRRKNEQMLMQAYSETITDPEQAMVEVKDAFLKISTSMVKAQSVLEEELTDTTQVNPE